MRTHELMKAIFGNKLKCAGSLVILLACSYAGNAQRPILKYKGSGPLPANTDTTQIKETGSTNIDVGSSISSPVGGRFAIWSAPNFARAVQLNMSSNGTTLTSTNTALNLYNRDMTANNWARLNFAGPLQNGTETDLISLACHYRSRAGNGTGDFVIATTDVGGYAERVRLNSNGNFGIGNYGLTAVPERLNVLGNASIGNDNGLPGVPVALGANDNYLSFCGSSVFGGNGTRNSDMLRMYRINTAADASQLRVEIGDNFGNGGISGPDIFVIGGTNHLIKPVSFLPLLTANVSSAAVGIGTTSIPANRLEIKSDMTLGQTESGLRLTNLTSVATPVSNPGSGVLSVNANGDVIYVPSGGVGAYTASQGVTLNGMDFQLGQACGTTPRSGFTTDREIHMSNSQINHNLYFNGGTNGTGGKLYMGISSCPNLQARLELGSSGLNPAPVNSYSTSNPSLSGLRFSDLTMSTPTIPNTGNGVLSLDANGDVIWVAKSAGAAMANNGCSVNGANVQLGEDCNAPTGLASLISDRVVPMNDFNIVFGDGSLTAPGKNRIGIGTNCMPQAKLEVIRNYEGPLYDVTNRAIAGINKDIASPASGAGEAAGVFGSSDNSQNMYNLGGDFSGMNANQSSYGVRGVAIGAGAESFGGWFSGCGAPNLNVGVYGDACSGGTSGTEWAGYFNGNTFTSGLFISSDRRLKEDVQPIENALEIIGKIQPKKYKFNTSAFPGLNLPSNKDNYGVIAQDLEEILPALVKETPVPTFDKKGFTKETIKTVNYIELVPILIQAVKEQQIEIEQLQQQNEVVQALQKQIDQLKSLVANSGLGVQNESIARLNVTLTDKHVIVLGQNVPNPCDKATTIAFNIPASVKTATIRFATLDGKVIQSVDAADRGKGVVNVYTSDLKAGVYIYTLITDGNVIDTKRMQVIR